MQRYFSEMKACIVSVDFSENLSEVKSAGRVKQII